MARRRSGRPSGRAAKQRVRTAKGRPNASTRWLQRQLNDPYVHEAKRRGYRSRAAFKLIDINERFKLLAPGMCIVDLGAAPGGWSQIAIEILGERGRVVAVDRLEFEPLRGVEALVGDFNDSATQDAIRAALDGTADVVLSDMGPSTTGHASTDHLRSAVLAEAAFDFAREVLATGGGFLVKLRQGAEEQAFVDALGKCFDKVRRVKPPASRDRSAEMYVVATGFRG